MKITEEMYETTYVNELKLIVVDHPSGTQIVNGIIRTLREPYAPKTGVEEDGTDCLDKVKDKDGIYWTSNMDNKDINEDEDLRDGIILTFDKPADARRAKVVVSFKNTPLLEHTDRILSGLPQDSPGLVDLRRSINHLHLEVWSETGMVAEKTFQGAGSYVDIDDIRAIDVSGVTGSELTIKLNSTTGLVLIDSVMVDYSKNETVYTTELSATTAVDANGIDVAPQVLSDDADYLVLEQGDYACLSFDEPDAIPDHERSYIVKAKGYYESPITTNLESETRRDLLEQFLADPYYAIRYLFDRYRPSHCGIYLCGQSLGNVINFNNITDNVDHGIYNESSDVVDATNNWWGDVSGPYHATTNPGGTGNAVTDYVDYEPWLGAAVAEYKSQETGGGTVTVDATTEADTTVIKTGSGTPTITVVQYTNNPGGITSGGFSSMGNYIDVHIDDPTNVDEIEIRSYYTEADVAGLDEASLKLSWWNGTMWVACSDSGVTYPAGGPTYRGYIWAKIKSTGTIPSLAQLTGTPFMSMGIAPIGGVSAWLFLEYRNEYGNTVGGAINLLGKLKGTIEAYSEDGKLVFTLPVGSRALDKNGLPLRHLKMTIVEEPPPGASIVGPAYNFEPDGATFDPPTTLTAIYDPEGLPEGVAEEDLYIAWWDGSKWVALETTVATETNTVSCQLSHFTIFAVVGGTSPPAPADFSLVELEISPAEAEIGSTITISALVANNGGEQGTCAVTLKINGAAEEVKHAVLDPGASERMIFTTSRDTSGSYSVDVNGLFGSFTVKEKPAPTAPPPPPEVIFETKSQEKIFPLPVESLS